MRPVTADDIDHARQRFRDFEAISKTKTAVMVHGSLPFTFFFHALASPFLSYLIGLPFLLSSPYHMSTEPFTLNPITC
jgi:hypothetical protein